MSSSAFIQLLTALSVAGLGGFAFQESITVFAPPGATVTGNSLFGACESGAVCEFPLEKLPYQDVFEVQAADGYRVVGWTSDTHESCASSPNRCEPKLTSKNFFTAPTTHGASVKFQPVIESISEETKTAWQYPAEKRWDGSALEGAIDYCSEAAIRWIGPTSNFDVNNDGISDVLLHTGCYQEQWPENPQEIHNIEVIAAWKMFCSNAEGTHFDCTEQLFGSEAINATSSTGGGGNPYVHVMNQPRDLNGDGYPEFWYALNRDDGRTSYPEGTQAENEAYIKELCGPTATADCTRDSYQSMLISRNDGSYQIAFADTPPINTQAVEVFPNLMGTFDMVMFAYGSAKISRWTGSTFIDVTDEWRDYENFDLAVERGDVYVHAFEDEQINQTYLVVPNVHSSLVGRERAFKDIARQPDLHLGFTLWQFEPGAGFTLSDYYTPKDSDLFAAKVGSGEDDGNYELQEGVYINEIPTILPNYYHIKATRLNPDGELILFVQQEQDGGSTFGDFLKTPIDEEQIYTLTNGNIDNEDGYLALPLTPVQTFYIRDGKLEETEEPLIEAGYLWNSPGMFLQDLNGDGHKDMLGKSGHKNRGSIYINDGSGKLVQKRISGATPEIWFHDRLDNYNYGAYPLHLDSDDKLDLMFWEAGSTGPSPDGPGEVVILKGLWEAYEFDDYSPTELNTDIANCYINEGWMGACAIF